MNAPLKATGNASSKRPGNNRLRSLLLCCALVFPLLAQAQTTAGQASLDALAMERKMLTKELEQYGKTLELLQTDGTPPEQSSNPAIKKLAQEMVNIKIRLIAVTEQEVTLLQQKIMDAKALAGVNIPEAAIPPGTFPADGIPAGTAPVEAATEEAMESKPLRSYNASYTLEEEAEYVERLHQLLASYYADLQESARTLPTEEELSERQTAQAEAARLSAIPFNADKIRLNGAEGSTALSQISQRLVDPTIPESRRDIAPICSIKTRLFGSLIGSERRSLTPVGKNHYIAKIRLQPGNTTLSIMDQRWEVRLPQDVSAAEYLVTLYRPPRGAPELHVFAVEDLLAEDEAHIPAWLPKELQLNKRSG